MIRPLSLLTTNHADIREASKLRDVHDPLLLLNEKGCFDLDYLPGRPTCISIIDIAKRDPEYFRNIQTTTIVPFYKDWDSRGKILCEYPDQSYHQSIIYPYYQAVKEHNEPQGQLVRSQLCDRMVQYRRLILPFKKAKLLLVLYWVDFLIDASLAQVTVLSGREKECLSLLASGYSAKMAAHHLGLAVRTVEHYIESAKQKLRAKNSTHATSILLLHSMSREEF